MPHQSTFLSNIPFTPQTINKFADLLNKCSPVELSDLLEMKSFDEQMLIFNALSQNKAVETFEYLPFRIQKDILKALPSQQIADLLNALAPDDRTTFLEELPQNIANKLLQYLSPKEREISIKMLGYPEDSVGRIMTPDYLSVKLDWTVRKALDYIRENGHDSETVNVIYAVDENGVLIEDFRIRQLLFASLDCKLSELADNKFIALKVTDNKQKAINVFSKYDRVALPVVDDAGMLVGIVTSDDIIKLAISEDTIDMQKIGGVVELREPYMTTPFFELMSKRAGWLIVLFLGELLTASAMGYFEEEISKAVVLALFLPLIISSGGNAGSQASTLIIRAMALGEVTIRDWWHIMRREIFSGLFLGTTLGIIGFFRVTLWSAVSNIYGEHWLLIAVTIFLALIGVVAWGSLAGSMLPLFLRRCGFDPAVSSAPFVATIVDVTGLIIYFSIAMFVLQGTLL